VDISPLFISEAKKRYGDQPGLSFLVGDVEDMSFPGQTFDLVCSSLLLEHVTDVKRTLKEMCRVLKNEGLLIVVAPNYLDPVQHLKTAYIQRKVEDKHKPWEAKTRIGAFFQFIRITCVLVGKALRINRKIYYLKPILSNEKSNCGQDFDATWLSNRFDISNILSELGFSLRCLFPDDPEGKTIQIMRALGLPEVLQSSYKRMRASGFVIVGKKK
jgi:SAM-dependent methyltransferase